MDQLVQIIGAVLILVAFAALQRGRMSPHSLTYLVLNLAGSIVLTAVAIVEFDLGFLLLEAVWAIVSLWSLVQVLRGRAPSTAH
jgi:uncharacterized membrane protein